MNRIGKFEKVSFEQFSASMKSEIYGCQNVSEGLLKAMWETIILPERSTVGSAGYDFRAPFAFTLRPGESIKIPTGIRVLIEDGWFLACLPRSGLGFKYHIGLANTCGIVDSDYARSDNEGHIFAKLVNNGTRDVTIHTGDGFMQGIFLPFGITYTDDTDGIRNGGFGSTDSNRR